jgi:hypothetical protein
VILDNYNPNLLWYIGGVLCFTAALGFYFLHVKVGREARFIKVEAETSGAE